MPTPLRLIVADDHALFRQGLRSMLTNLHPDVSVVGEVDRVSEVVPALDRTPCDVLLLDLQMERNALADIEGFARRVRVVVVTASQQAAEALAAIALGLAGDSTHATRLADDLGPLLQGSPPSTGDQSATSRLSDVGLVKFFRLVRLARRLLELEVGPVSASPETSDP